MLGSRKREGIYGGIAKKEDGEEEEDDEEKEMKMEERQDGN